MSDSKEEIMDATFKALCKHGYADLSIQKIADESDKGKSLIYYHFDDKGDLMLSFLDFLMEKADFEYENDSPEARIDGILDKALGIESEEQWEFQKAFQELRVQAQHNEKFQEKFQEADRIFLENVSEIMSEAGAENSEVAAEIFLSMIEGSISRKVASGDREGLKELKEDMKDTISAFLDDQCCSFSDSG
ncbi:TetR family transcriptional regulator [Candidatus Nanohaloarchaea archaeon]|nr:TetR family transcriptional regulator [Candidatus Nanohaloarchaea archaeon]